MKKIAVVLLIIIALVFAISIYIYINRASDLMSKEEKEAAIAKILGRKPNLSAKDVPTGNIKFKGKYITFIYPAAAAIKKQLLNGEEIPYTGLELFIFSLENPKIRVHIEVIETPQNVKNINDYPSVKLRQIQSNLYTQKDTFVGNIRGLSFEKQNNTNFEKTGFFFLNDKIYSFSIESPDSKAAKELFNKLTSSAKFL